MRVFRVLSGFSALKLFLVFLKIGVLFFGGGYVVIPVMHRELVQNLHWLTEQQFIDGTAISQLTPGPVAVLATFAGCKVGGVIGALVATVAVLIPGSILMILLSRSYAVLRELDAARRVMDTLIPVVAGLLLAAAWMIGRQTMTGWCDALVFAISLVALVRYRVNPVILIAAGALLGLVLHVT